MKPLPPQPHKPRYYYYSMQPSEVVPTEMGLEIRKFMGTVQQMEADHGYLNPVADWHTEETYDDPDECFEEIMVDMGNVNKPERIG